MASASDIVEIFALIFWSFQLSPQVYQNYKSSSTAGLSSLLLLSWSLGSVFTGINNIASRLSPLFIIQPNLFLVFSLACYVQCQYYGGKSFLSVFLHGFFSTFIFFSVEMSLSLVLLHYSISSPASWVLILINSLSLVFFILGFAPQYYEIYKRKRVEGISRLFLCIDITGSILSIVALALTSDFQPVSGACYIGVFVFDMGIMFLSFIIPSPQPLENNQPAESFQPLENNDHSFQPDVNNKSNDP